MQKQTTIVKQSELTHRWVLVDASTAPLGRLASKIATILMGKNKANYSSNLDNGDYVVVINAKKAVLTGNKLKKKIYYTQVSQQPGGLRKRTAETMVEKYPEELVLHAVRGMLPKTKLGKKMLAKCFVYPDAEHPHQGQKPVALEEFK
jgi:large subunit ribosomal protein L13